MATPTAAAPDLLTHAPWRWELEGCPTYLGPPTVFFHDEMPEVGKESVEVREDRVTADDEDELAAWLFNFYDPTHIAPEHAKDLLATILSGESAGEETPRRWTLLCAPKHLEMGPPTVRLQEPMPSVRTGEVIGVRDVRLSQEDEDAFTSTLTDLYGIDVPDSDDVCNILTTILSSTR